MEFNYAYKGDSSISNMPGSTDMSFAPDTKREPTFFVGELRKNIAFREVMSALHDVVVSNLKFVPKDRTEYMAWLAQQEELDWASVLGQRTEVKKEMEELQAELKALYKRQNDRWAPFNRARRAFFQWSYEKYRDLWYVLDPVITVHPDEVFFECFSQDESTYGRVGASYEVFQNIGEFACGTTNVDYSQALYDEFQKIRSYKTTKLEVDPSGFEVETAQEESYKEVKIDLPDTWVRGFLQVSSAMSLDATTFDLHPMDLHNLCFVLRRNKEKRGPRGMRYQLEPGKPINVVFEPWNIEVICPRSIYQGPESIEIRVWGRRRIHTLERLIPVAKKFTVYLLGTGMPSFYVADLGDLSFTLGLSGWTANDWSKAGNFDLMAPRAEVDDFTKRRVFDGLKENWREDPDELAGRLALDPSIVKGALSAYTQAGRAIYDLNKKVYRVRELTREPLPMDKLRFTNEREEKATTLVHQGHVKVAVAEKEEGALEISATVKDGSKKYTPKILIDRDQALRKGECSCNYYQQNKLYKGPCEHMLAARIAHSRPNEIGSRKGGG